MQLVAINSGRPEGNTYGILNQINQILAEKDFEVNMINLREYNIKPCIGCENCLRKDVCHINDDADRLMDELKRADGIIIASPVYMGSIHGKLKMLFDRTCRWYHRPVLIAKPVLLVSTTAGSSLKYTLDYMEKVAVDWGLYPAGRVGRKTANLSETVTINEIKDFINALDIDREEYNPSLKQLIAFQVQKILADKILEIDRAYWVNKGWNKSLYYYDCNINYAKKLSAKLFHRFLDSRIKPGK